MKFTIIIPILNEDKNILKLIKLIKKHLKNITYEVIFVDDSSTDNTQKILRKIKSKKIKYIFRNKKRDLSGSCIEGLGKSKYNNIVIMDGDLQHHPSCLIKMISFYVKKKPAVLIGTRKFSSLEGLGFFRRIASRTLILIMNTLLGKKTSDPMSGFFIIKKEIFNKIKSKLYNRGFKILADILYSLNKNYLIYDLNIKFRKRKKNITKMNIFILMHLMIMILYKLKKKLLYKLFISN